jgi:hypothetical protein
MSLNENRIVLYSRKRKTMYVNLIESVRQVKNQVEVIATVETKEGKTFLGIADFFLRSDESIPDDEDDLAYFLEDMDLIWDLYIPH